jgi:hypothetical protein
VVFKILVRHPPSLTTVRASAIKIPGNSSVLLINPIFSSHEFVGTLTTVSHIAFNTILISLTRSSDKSKSSDFSMTSPL